MSGGDGMSADLERVLRDGEQMLWHGRPHRRSLLLQHALWSAPVVLFVGPFVVLPLLALVFMAAAALDSGTLAAAGVVAVLVGSTGFTGLLVYLTGRRIQAHAEYAVTDRRLVAFGGLVGRDYSSVDWATVRDFEVNVGLLNERYGTGTVSAITAGGGASGVAFKHVPDPYAVHDRIETLRGGGAR